MSRALLYIIAIPLILVLAAAILVPLLLDEEKLLRLAADEVRKQTGAELTVDGDVDLSLFPTLGLSLEQVALQMPTDQQPSLQARYLQIGVQVAPLLSGAVAIDTVFLDGVLLKIVTQPAPAPIDTSQFNDEQLAEFYARRQAAIEEAGRAAATETAVAVPLALEVAQLEIKDSRLEISEVGGDTSTVDIVSLKTTGLNLENRPIPLSARISIPEETPINISLEGVIMVSQANQVMGIENMEVAVEGALPETITLGTSGEVDLRSQVADLNLVADVGETRAEGQLRYAAFESPQIDTQLRMNLFSPALLALAGPEAAEAAPAGNDEAGEDDVALPLTAIRAMDTRADLKIDKVVWGNHEVDNLRAKMRVVNGAATLPKVTGEIHGGALEMKANLNAKQSVAKINTEGGLKGVDIARALAAAEVKPVLSGIANLQWKLHGKGNTSNAITQTLRGPIDLTTEQAQLQDMAIEKMLCQTVALINQEQLAADFPASSAFRALSVKMNLGQGKARLQPLKASFPDVRLLGKGVIDLQTMDFDTTFTAKLSPGLAKLDPACRVNERITAIDWPVDCRGNVTGEPADWCAVDSADIIEDLAENEIKRKAKKEVEKRLGDEAGGLLKGLLGDD